MAQYNFRLFLKPTVIGQAIIDRLSPEGADRQALARRWIELGYALEQAGFQRGTIAYDPVNDIVHVLWASQQPRDGIIYRRYHIKRDGHRIVELVRDDAINLQLDHQVSGTLTYGQPTLLWLSGSSWGPYGALVALWSTAAFQDQHVTSEVRASMRILSGSQDDQVAANWQAPGAGSGRKRSMRRFATP